MESQPSEELLKYFQGLLHTDCYKGWLSIYHETKGQFDLQLCWVHAKHKFVKVVRETSGATEQEIRIALHILLLFRKMFGIERKIGKLRRVIHGFCFAFDGASGGTGSHFIHIEATPNWKAEHPREILKDFQGPFHTDCYKGWLSIFHEAEEGWFDLQLC